MFIVGVLVRLELLRVEAEQCCERAGVAPFLLIDDVAVALRLSNAVAVSMSFLTGFVFGREIGRPYRTGFLMVAIGVALVAIAMMFGG